MEAVGTDTGTGVYQMWRTGLKRESVAGKRKYLGNLAAKEVNWKQETEMCRYRKAIIYRTRENTSKRCRKKYLPGTKKAGNQVAGKTKSQTRAQKMDGTIYSTLLLRITIPTLYD
jgi:hypothetical protein